MVPPLIQAAQDLVERFLPHPGSVPSSELEATTTSASDDSRSPAAGAGGNAQDGCDSSICMLPEDIIFLILSWLSPEDVVACKRTCRFLSHIVANDAQLQYRLALAASGMVNGPPGGMPLDERVARLEAYRARTDPTKRDPAFSCEEHVWPRSERPYVMVLVCDRTVFYAVVARNGEYDIEIRTPGAAPRHLSLPELPVSSYLKAADVSQDLLIVGEGSVEVVAGHRKVTLKMHLLSIESGKPHPAAAVPWIEVRCDHGAESPVQIFRDKVVWQRCDHDAQTSRDVEVWNWHTGALLWHHNFKPQVSFVFLDDNHLIVTAYRQEAIMVYALHGQEPASTDHEAQPVLILELPLGAFRCAVHYDDRSRIHRSSGTAGLPFVPDPMLAVTAIRFSIYAPELSTGLLLIPGSTIYEQLMIASEAGLQPHRVFWHEWGPEGALLLNLTGPKVVGRISFDTYGSRVALVVHNTTREWFNRKESVDVVVLELNPRAVRAVENSTLVQDSGPPRAMSREDIQYLQFSKLRATVPHLSYVGPGLSLPDRHGPTMISMTADGMMILNEWEPPYQERRGFGYQDFTYEA